MAFAALAPRKSPLKAIVNYRDVPPQSDSAQKWALRERAEETGEIINGPSAGIPSDWYWQLVFLASAVLCGTECQISALCSWWSSSFCSYELPRVPSKMFLGCGPCQMEPGQVLTFLFPAQASQGAPLGMKVLWISIYLLLSFYLFSFFFP